MRFGGIEGCLDGELVGRRYSSTARWINSPPLPKVKRLLGQDSTVRISFESDLGGVY
jgi:hypothetical protein